MPALVGWLLIGGWYGFFAGLFWGGAVRIFLLHHVTFSINSICHFWGRRRFASRDESRNVWWLSWLSFGESWHNNHHAFPTSAFHGLRRTEIDPGGWLIWLLERAGLAWNVVRIPPDKQAASSRRPAKEGLSKYRLCRRAALDARCGVLGRADSSSYRRLPASLPRNAQRTPATSASRGTLLAGAKALERRVGRRAR